MATAAHTTTLSAAREACRFIMLAAHAAKRAEPGRSIEQAEQQRIAVKNLFREHRHQREIGCAAQAHERQK